MSAALSISTMGTSRSQINLDGRLFAPATVAGASAQSPVINWFGSRTRPCIDKPGGVM